MNAMPAPRPDLTLDEIIEDLRLLVYDGVFPPTGKYPQTDPLRGEAPTPGERRHGARRPPTVDRPRDIRAGRLEVW